tara:strand:+ start:1193 stop:1663 length:471 start_codon:yes stop_codon:yes gene_type:complete
MGIDLGYGSDSTHIYVSGIWYRRDYHWLAYPLQSFPSGGIYRERPAYYQDYEKELKQAKAKWEKAKRKSDKERWERFAKKFAQGFFGWADDKPQAPHSRKKEDYPYSVFGLTRSASDEDMKKAYRKSVLKAHPDRGGTCSAFRKVRNAWEYFKNYL